MFYIKSNRIENDYNFDMHIVMIYKQSLNVLIGLNKYVFVYF